MLRKLFKAVSLFLTFGLTISASSTIAADVDLPLRIGISGFALQEHRDQIVEATENALRPLFGSRFPSLSPMKLQLLERQEVGVI